MFSGRAFAPAFAGDRGFDVNLASQQRDKDLLERARIAFEKQAIDAASKLASTVAAPRLCVALCCA